MTAPAGVTDFDEFKLIRVLGQGGMGAVYLGHDTLLDRQVAIKLIRADASDRSQFLTEARAIARLSHPNVVAIYRTGTTRAGEPYIAQELIRGDTLSALARPMPSRRVAELGLGIARGLAAAHRRGILHRDIKPANVMVDQHGTPRLLDFGIAKLVGASVTSSPTIAVPAGAVPAGAVPGGAVPAGAVSAAAAPDRPEAASGLAITADLPIAARSAAVAAPAAEPSTRVGWEATGATGSRDGMTVPGTPGYLAPELWAGEAASVRSDLWALGVVMYELVAGARPFTQTDFAALAAAVQLDAAPPVAAQVPDVDPDLAALIARCLERDPARRPESADEVAFGLERILAGAPPVPDGNPYPGLAPFDAAHRGVFYGRGADVSAIVDRLRGEAVVVIAGDSGVGKSSVCRAGVAPAIAGGALADHRSWDARHVAVGRLPATALRDQLGLAAAVAPTPSAIAAAVGGDRTGGILIVIDQLEELVTIADPAEAAAAAELIAALAGDVPGIKLVLAVRGDFLTRVATLAALGPILTRGLYVLRGLDRSGARDAVVGPARAKAVRFGSDAMIDELVDSIAADPGSLPLLQFALAELWEHRDVDAGVIPATALAAIGGVAGGLARHADGVITGVAAGDRAAARRLVLALVTRDGTRASRSRAELVGDEPAAARALEALVRGRLIVARDTVEGATYTLAHESLITAWGTLHGWLDDVAGQRGLRARISAAADEWHLDRRDELLWSRAQLRETAGLDDLAARDREFLAASARASRRRRAARIAIAAAVPIAAVATWFGYARYQRAIRDRDVAKRVDTATHRLAAATTTAATAHARRAAAFAAFDRGAPDAEATWRDAQAVATEALRDYADATTELEAALIEGGDRADVRARIAEALYQHALVADETGDAAAADALIRRIAIYGGDAQLAAWRAPAELTVDAAGARRIEVAPYVDEAATSGALALAAPVASADGAHLTAALPPGSYRIELTGADGLIVHDPIVLARGEHLAIADPLPPATAVPDGCIYIPAGRFLLGSNGDDDVRRDFQFAPPMHPVRTGAYLIARTEVTFGEYMTYLRALSPDDRARRRPPSLTGDGPFTLVLVPASETFRAAEGEPLIYPGRSVRREVHWDLLPVDAVSFEDVTAYAAWLASTGAVPGARLCTDLEWERAARGADGRRYPHGATLEPDDANIDVTYGRDPLSYGPDEVGSHPRSTSPFGVVDMTGNLWEVVRGVADRPTLRGGGYYQGRTSALTTNHGQTQPTARPVWAGARICADPPPAITPRELPARPGSR